MGDRSPEALRDSTASSSRRSAAPAKLVTADAAAASFAALTSKLDYLDAADIKRVRDAYRFADEVTKQLGLNLKIYLPRRSRAHREAVEGATPALHDPRHAAFTAEVKLEPFARALRETAPQVWFTALRATDTAVRAQMDPVSINPDGLIKVAPLLHWSSKDLHEYCVKHGLPNNFDYVDPTKGEDNRECGLHLAH